VPLVQKSQNFIVVVLLPFLIALLDRFEMAVKKVA